MIISREEKKIEAIKRMRLLGIHKPTISLFKNEDIVQISVPPIGAFFPLSDKDMGRLRQFEEDFDALVYMVVRTYSSIGLMDSFLYVPDNRDVWDMEREDIEFGQVAAYVYNHEIPECSETGLIGVETTAAAGLHRTW